MISPAEICGTHVVSLDICVTALKFWLAVEKLNEDRGTERERESPISGQIGSDGSFIQCVIY